MTPTSPEQALRLTPAEERMASGAEGEAVKWAIDLLIAIADYYHAPGLVDVVAVHTHEAQYGSQLAGLELMEDLAAKGARFRVPTSTNTAALDANAAEGWGVSRTYIDRQERMRDALGRMGASQTRTCHLPSMGTFPAFKQHAAWGESSTTTFLNSVIGARVTLHSLPELLASAIVGKAAAISYHLDENRRGNAVVRIEADMSKHSDWDALAIALGNLLNKGYKTVPVLVGLPPNVSQDSLKRLATIGAGPLGSELFHAIGLTPEAPTVEAALAGQAVQDDVTVSNRDIKDVYDYWNGAGEIDYAVFGCPHLSVNEYRQMSELFDGKKIHANVKAIIFVPDSIKAIGDYAGWTRKLENAGFEIRLGSSIVFHMEIPELRAQFANRKMLTDSTRAAYYAPGVAGEANVTAILRSREDAVEALVAGRV